MIAKIGTSIGRGLCACGIHRWESDMKMVKSDRDGLPLVTALTFTLRCIRPGCEASTNTRRYVWNEIEKVFDEVME